MLADVVVTVAARTDEAERRDVERHDQAAARAVQLVADAERRAAAADQRAQEADERADRSLRLVVGVRGRDGHGTSTVVARARRAAAQIAAEAKAEADRILSDAHTEAERVRAAGAAEVVRLNVDRDSIACELGQLTDSLRGLDVSARLADQSAARPVDLSG